MIVQKITFKNDYTHSPGRGEPIFYLASSLGNSVGVYGTHDNPSSLLRTQCDSPLFPPEHTAQAMDTVGSPE